MPSLKLLGGSPSTPLGRQPGYLERYAATQRETPQMRYIVFAEDDKMYRELARALRSAGVRVYAEMPMMRSLAIEHPLLRCHGCSPFVMGPTVCVASAHGCDPQGQVTYLDGGATSSRFQGNFSDFRGSRTCPKGRPKRSHSTDHAQRGRRHRHAYAIECGEKCSAAVRPRATSISSLTPLSRCRRLASSGLVKSVHAKA